MEPLADLIVGAAFVVADEDAPGLFGRVAGDYVEVYAETRPGYVEHTQHLLPHGTGRDGLHGADAAELYDEARHILRAHYGNGLDWQRAEPFAASIGRAHGRNAADWWEQDAIGGRSTGDPKPTAERVLAGLDDGDPEIYDALPYPDLSGQWAGGYSSADLYDEIASEFGLDPDELDEIDVAAELADIYESAFREAVEDRITQHCRSVLA